jgi:hypothetical protein
MEIDNPHKIKKDRLRVVILTQGYRVEGDVHILPDGRLTDFINSKTSEDFIAVTDAEVFPASQHDDVLRVDYIAINKSYITMVYPLVS